MNESDPNCLPPECIVCGRIAWQPKFEALQQCDACSFIRANMQVDRETLESLYQESYFRGDEYGDYLADHDVHHRNFMRRLREIEKLYGRPENVYEVGCAYGIWLQALSQQNITGSGIDICAEPVRHATEELNLDATCGDFLSATIEPGRYDLFCLWDTIEHLPRPELFLQRIFELLPVGGNVVFTTGDIGSRYAQRRGSRWRMIHPPTHLHYFSQATATQLLQRSGFSQVHTQSISIYRNVHSVLGALVALESGFTRSTASIMSRLIPGRLQKFAGTWVNLGDIMFVSATKQSPQHRTESV